MPFTVITVKNIPASLRGDLTKWMQEIATGVYVGSFNTKVRELLWQRVKESVGTGEATMSFSYRNEIGYSFDTIRTQREAIDYDGIPLIRLSCGEEENVSISLGFSKAAKSRKMRKFTASKKKLGAKTCVFIDIETSGMNVESDIILEIGALKVTDKEIEEFSYLIYDKPTVTANISNLIGITQELLEKEGKPIEIVLTEFIRFIDGAELVGYNVEFDINFLNNKLRRLKWPTIKNKRYDLLHYVKKEKIFWGNYKLQTVLNEYGIDETVPHRAILDAKLLYQLSMKVNKFMEVIGKE